MDGGLHVSFASPEVIQIHRDVQFYLQRHADNEKGNLIPCGARSPRTDVIIESQTFARGKGEKLIYTARRE